MMDYIIAFALIAMFTANIVISLYCSHIQSKASNMRSSAIYLLYKELKRMNDRCEKNGENNA